MKTYYRYYVKGKPLEIQLVRKWLKRGTEPLWVTVCTVQYIVPVQYSKGTVSCSVVDPNPNPK
jgi:hypothetical protein